MMDGSPARAIDGAGVDREVKAGGGWRVGDGGLPGGLNRWRWRWRPIPGRRVNYGGMKRELEGNWIGLMAIRITGVNGWERLQDEMQHAIVGVGHSLTH